MNNNHINYVEFKAKDLEAVKAFYQQAFGWKFTDYGPDYTAFEEVDWRAGFEQWDEPVVNGVLVVLYHQELEAVLHTVLAAGGENG